MQGIHELTTAMRERFDAATQEIDFSVPQDMDGQYRKLFPDDLTLDQFRSLWLERRRAAQQQAQAKPAHS